MAIDILTSRQLALVRTDNRNASVPTYFLDNFFNGGILLSTAEEIAFEEIPTTRTIAPFVQPTEQGRPIYRRLGSRVKTFRPAYIKPKDPLRATDNMIRLPGEMIPGGLTGNYMTPAARRAQNIVNIVRFQDDSIRRTWDWMACCAIRDGFVNINYAADQQLPNVRVDFGRDAAHTEIRSTGSFWGDAGVSILEHLEDITATMASAEFGAAPVKMLIGSAAYKPFMNAVRTGELKDQMDTRYRGDTTTNLQRGLISTGNPAQPATFIGSIGAIQIYLFSGTFLDPKTNTTVPMMDPRDIILTGPDVGGIRCFGAIQDKAAGLLPTDIFTKMWDEEDPSAEYIMSQSAPLMVPVNPNQTYRARVVAG